MDDTGGGGTSAYQQNSHGGVNGHRGYGSSQKSNKLPSQDSTYSKSGENNNYSDQEEEDEELKDDEEVEEDIDVNGMLVVDNGDQDKEHGNNDNDDDDDEDDFDDEEEAGGGSSDANHHHRKKQKLKSILLNYELVPRVQPPISTTNTVAPSSLAKSTGGRNPLTDWTEHETAVLLDAWGECFLRHGRKSLRSEEWLEVAEKVSQQSRVERTDSQCRNRLDTLKKRYKKEKTMMTQTRGGATVPSNWVFFREMDMLMSSPSQQPPGLSCGMDSGEYVFMNPKVYLNRANGLDEMKDSPGNSLSSSQEGEGGGSDELTPRRKKGVKRKKIMRPGGSFQLLADSVQKFNVLYEEIESKKRQQMIELEKMRMNFYRDIEMQRRLILEKAQAEIVKMRQGCDDDEENDDDSDENVSG